MVLVLRKLRKNCECGTWKLEMMIEGERMKRMELNVKFDVLVSELEGEKMLENWQK